MNPISQYLVNEILKDNTTLIYGGGFKFPTRGHLEVVKQSLEQHPQFNKYIIFVGSGERDGITQQQSIDIWNIYKKYFSFNIEIIPVPSPVKAVFDYSKENPQENVIWVIGGRQDNEDDMKDFINRTKTIKKYPNITASQVITPLSNISGTKARQVLKTGDKSEVISYLPSNISDEDIEQIIDILMPPKQLNEIEEFDRIEYYTSFVSNVVPSDFNVFRDGDKIIVDNITNLPLFSIPESMSDPKKGTGKKPKGSGRRLYTDEDPSDTVSIKFSSKQDIIDTLSKSSFKSKSHKRQSQIINVIHQRVRAAYQRAKDPKIKARLKTALDYAEQRKEASKEKTQRLKKENVAPNHTGKSAPYGSGYKELNENASYSKDIDYKSYIKELTNYMIEDGWNILPLPKIIFRHGNKENAKNLLGKTAYYDPNTQTIVLYTEGRHPKDILRSFSHEMVHHMQNIEDRLGNITTTNTLEDDHLNDIEAEANLKGTMTFRNWTDSLNEKKNKDPFGINQYARELAQGLEENDIEDNGRSSPYGSGDKKIKEYTNKYKKYVLNELFEKDLPIIDKVSKNLYIVSNGNDIEAKYDIRLEIPERDLWSINWFFTPNNKNESTEAWKQVTATSFRVLEDWLKTNNPKALYISGNTGAKTKLYKAYVDKLQTLLNNRYKIDNSDEDRVILRSIEEIKKSSIKKRIETLNESYDQALNYFQNGDINSKSKIERWSSIKHKIERKVIKEMYKITEEQPQNYIIYCDMDGVIADFDKRFTDLSGMSPNQYEEKYGIEQFWNFIDNEIGVRFWVGIPWMQDGKQLWEYIKKYKPTLLSAPSRNNESRLGKRLWVKKHIPGAKLVLASRANKQDYAKPNAILIDDRPDTIIEWENKGGIGILHKSAEETIQKLKSLDL
jgi:hypothetical protein